MAATVLRPCFGSPTAYLVHGDNQFYRGKNGHHKTRCHICPASEACALIGRARLVSDDRTEAAYNSFSRCGGRVALAKARTKNETSAIVHAYREVLAALEAHGPFSSVNDARIRDYCDELLAKQRDKDLKRQNVARDRDRAARIGRGEFDEAFTEQMWRERVYRQGLFRSAQSKPGAPSWLVNAGPDGALFASHVWYVKSILLVSRRKPNPSVIASELIARNWVITDNQNTLRGRVARTLERIVRLETAVFSGRADPVWEKLDLTDLMTAHEEPT